MHTFTAIMMQYLWITQELIHRESSNVSEKSKEISDVL